MVMSSATARNVLVKVFPLAIKIPADVGVGRSSGKREEGRRHWSGRQARRIESDFDRTRNRACNATLARFISLDTRRGRDARSARSFCNLTILRSFGRRGRGKRDEDDAGPRRSGPTHALIKVRATRMPRLILFFLASREECLVNY